MGNFGYYPQPETGAESSQERAALHRAYDASRKGPCRFTAQDADVKGRWPYEFRVLELREVPVTTTYVGGSKSTKTFLWIRYENVFRPTCTGWARSGEVAPP